MTTSLRFQIQHPVETTSTINGIIERVRPEEDTHGQPIALILHGVMGHKDYLFQKRLAKRLSIDSCRFDFRGNHESTGDWFFGQTGFDRDEDDISVVARHLIDTYGYVVKLVVAHSRATGPAMRWISLAPEAENVAGYVNVSSRYRMEYFEKLYGKKWASDFEKQGFAIWTARVAGQMTSKRIYPADIESLVAIDIGFVWERFPLKVDVLSVQGLKDDVVPPLDAVLYARAFAARQGPGTHNLHFVEEADHSYYGFYDELIETILEWWSRHELGTLKEGIWLAGERPKL